MISTPQFEREKMIIVLDKLAETLTAVSSNLSENRDEVALVWADNHHIYLESVASELESESIDLCFQAGRLFLSAAH